MATYEPYEEKLVLPGEVAITKEELDKYYRDRSSLMKRDGYSTGEIARALDISESRVISLLYGGTK